MGEMSGAVDMRGEMACRIRKGFLEEVAYTSSVG